MKSMQTYLMKPQQLRKKLQNPKFRSTFLQWSKSNISINSKIDNKPSRSKSPVQNYQRSLNLYHNSKSKLTSNSFNKENIRPINNSLGKNNIKLKVTSKDNKDNLYHKNGNKSTNSILLHNQQNNNISKQSNSPPNTCSQLKKRTISENHAMNNNKNYQSAKSLDKSNINSANQHKQLSQKNRYNSCSSILEKGNDNQPNHKKKQRSISQTDITGHHHNSSSNQQKLKRTESYKDKINQPFSSTLKIKYAYRTKQGVQITNPNKTNQDSLLIKTNFIANNSISKETNGTNNMIFAVADGHGMFGHLVSQYLVRNLSKTLQAQMVKAKNKSLHQAIPFAYNKLQEGLEVQNNSKQNQTHQREKINASCSGSTLVNVFLSIQNQQIICANVGDSRAILARQIDKKNWEMIYLSQDHKPTIEAEKKRILRCGGKIHAFRDQNGCPVGPQRVWLPNQNMQGLAMSRSFGDNISKPVGVTHIPQIIKLKIDRRDKFILLASDGVWQFITNQQVLQLLVPFYRQNKLQEACDALLNLAYQRWTVQDKSIVDDITLILIFLDHNQMKKKV